MAIKRFLFSIQIQGYGEDADSAWLDATEQFSVYPGPTPAEVEYQVLPEDEEEVPA